ncbi:MAG: insulinase family protein [Epsilonproteobacteria bacterium]|nr:MAG: insulinase family protein [Campylobacterota bacterium]
MTRWLILILFVFQGFAVASQVKFIKHNDKNIPIIFEHFKQLPIFNLQLIFKNSGYIQDGDKPGQTYMLSKLLNEGTKKDGTTKFASKLESKAISLSVHNGFETFVLEISSLIEHKNEAIKLLNELLKDPNITDKTVSKLKTQQISTLKQKQTDFDYVSSAQLKSTMYKNTKLSFGSFGDIKKIKTITKADIKSRYENLLNINNLIIVGGGDISFENLQSLIKPTISILKDKQTTKPSFIDTNKTPIKKITTKPTKQAYIYFGSPFYLKHNSDQLHIAKVASFILGGSGFGSRLMEQIRVKRGLAYSAYSHISLNQTHSSFAGYMQTDTAKQEQAVKLVKDIIKNFTTNGATSDELEKAKKFLIGSTPLKTETFSQRQHKAFDLYYKGLPQNYDKTSLNLIKNLKLDELNSFIKNHKEINELFISIVTNEKSK